MNNFKKDTLYIVNCVDVFSILFSFVFAFFVRFRVMKDITAIRIHISDYFPVLLLFVVAYGIVNVLYLHKTNNFLERDVFKESFESAKLSLSIVAIAVIFLNFAKVNAHYSRIFEVIFLIIFWIFNTTIRMATKSYMRKGKTGFGFGERIIIVSTLKEAEGIIDRIQVKENWRYTIVGLITLQTTKVKSIAGNKILGTFEKDSDFITIDYDAVVLTGNGKANQTRELIEYFRSRGKIVYFHVQEFDSSFGYPAFESLGEYPVVRYQMTQSLTYGQQLIKRLIDVVLSLLLMPIVLLLIAIVKVINVFTSQGPLLIGRTRVGQNNNFFRQYHFRIFRLDAWERIEKNESPYSFIGKFLEKTHLDGAPNLWNVLSGNMSFVGPKAPNLVKYLQMSAEEKNLLQLKPGLTGVWATLPYDNREEIILQEQAYSQDWSLWKDVLTLGKVFLRYIAMRSYRINGETHIGEELEVIRELNTEKKAFVYENNYTKSITEKERYYLSFKRLFDVCAAFMGLLVLAIPMLILTFLVYWEDRGNPFYGHERIGKNGKRIKIYKFRSMRLDAGDLEELLTPEQLQQYRKEFKITNDPRITKIGNILRKTSLDELPQLLNILKGDLSVVGPRPIVEEETKQYGKDIAKFLSIQPGLTGYWQAYARNNVGYEDGKRQAMELYYVDHQSLTLDIRIIFKTFFSVIKREGAK